jgi:predicted AAA+ superfamily ATPase
MTRRARGRWRPRIAGSTRGFTLSELLKTFLNRGDEPAVYFWRDSTGHEIDFLLDLGVDLVALEVKSGETVASDFFAGMRYWRGLIGDDRAPAAPVYGGDRSFRRDDVTVYGWADF